MKNLTVYTGFSLRFLKLITATILPVFFVLVTLMMPSPELIDSFLPAEGLLPLRSAKAGSTYYSLGAGTLSLNITPSSTGMITTNDDWSGVASVEGYFGQNLTATHGIDPQTVLTSEFATLPSPGNTQVAANKGNPSAFNAGGLAEFDSGTYLAIGFQGNVQANPYLLFYLNTSGRSNITMNYTVQDIDGGSNDAVSQLALQYRLGETGNFINVPAGYIADATDGGVAGRITTRNVVLPAAVNNQAKVQVRLITTNSANTSGGSTPDEWLGVNNITVSSSVTTAAGVSIGGRVVTAGGRPIAKVQVVSNDLGGNTRAVLTNPFGFYRFDDLQAGTTVLISVRAKGYLFTEPTRVLFLSDNLSTFDFIAAP
jgi:hypothetical protein